VTESELENAYWMIERAEITPSEFEAINAGKMTLAQSTARFSEISRIDGQGSAASRTEYAMVDSLVKVDAAYAYRLADVSFSGLVTFHQPALVKVSAPATYALLQNYPNPFNPNTSIEFRLPITSEINLKVFNILGQEVVTLSQGVKKAGFYKIPWNGTNRMKQPVASGIYIYLLTAKAIDGSSEFKDVNKMVLIK
jgi:hypothetical protein